VCSSDLLLFILLFRYGHEESLISFLFPPHSITWTSSPPVGALPVLSFITRLAPALTQTRVSNESLYWTYGCGNLAIASRAANIFACLLKPFSSSIISPLISRLSIVARCPPSALGICYLSALFKILNAGIDHFHKYPEFVQFFKDIYQIAKPFLNFPELRGYALSIIAKFLDQHPIPESESDALLPKLASLLVQHRPRRLIDGAFLSLFSTNVSNRSQEAETSRRRIMFLLFLPRYFSALAAVQNIAPFAASFTDTEIKIALQTIRCFANHPAIEEIEVNESKFPDEFLRSLALQLVSKYTAEVTTAAPFICEMARDAVDECERAAVLRLARAILRHPGFRLTLFAPIVPIAAADKSVDGREFLEECAELAEVTIVDRLVARDWGIVKEKVEWQEVLRDLGGWNDETIPEGDVVLTEFVQIAPTEQEMWKQSHVVEIRRKLARIRVKPFTEIEERIERIGKLKVVESEDQPGLVVRNVQQFIDYQNVVAEMRAAAVKTEQPETAGKD
jgi:hypothetical protein